jgi:predicted PurR-regulated permease PerM
MLSSQVVSLVNLIPGYLSTVAPSMVSNLNVSLVSQLENTIAFIPSIAQFFFSAFIVLTLSFYFIIDQSRINQEFFNLMPRKWHGTLKFVEKVVNDTFISFFRVQFFYGVSTAFVTWLVMVLFNEGFAVSVAFFAGIFAIVPLIGPLLAVGLPVLVALLGDPIQALIVGIVLFLAQQVIFNVIGPKLLGKAFSLHPAIILISLIIGLKFAGAIGAIFAIPVLGIGAVMIRTFGVRSTK